MIHIRCSCRVSCNWLGLRYYAIDHRLLECSTCIEFRSAALNNGHVATHTPHGEIGDEGAVPAKAAL